MKVRIYEIGCKKVIDEINVKSVYDSSFYFRPVPTISARTCARILNKIYPDFKAEKEMLVFENVKTGTKEVQYLHRAGTILNF